MAKRTPGRYYDHDGNEVPAVSHDKVDVWVCRRVRDYANAKPPLRAGRSVCVACGEAVAFNPAHTLDAPKVCIQCYGLTPESVG